MKNKYDLSVASVLTTAASSLALVAPLAADTGKPMYEIQANRRVSVAQDDEDIREAAARATVERMTPTNARLKELAAQSPPPPEWFEGEEEDLF